MAVNNMGLGFANALVQGDGVVVQSATMICGQRQSAIIVGATTACFLTSAKPRG